MLWKWKLARNLDDVMHLLNGETKYDRPVPDARVCMTWRGDHPQFWVFAMKAAKPNGPHDGLGGWGWKLATEPDDVLRFLRGDDPYSDPVGQAQVTAAWTGDHHLFYVFSRNIIASGQEQISGDWGWKLVTESDDAVLFLNGRAGHEHPVASARIATANRDHHDEFFVFYQHAGQVKPVDDWHWQAVGSPDDVRGAVERKGRPPVDFQVASPPSGHSIFQLFVNSGAHLFPTAARAEDRVSS